MVGTGAVSGTGEMDWTTAARALFRVSGSIGMSDLPREVKVVALINFQASLELEPWSAREPSFFIALLIRLLTIFLAVFSSSSMASISSSPHDFKHLPSQSL